MMTRRDGAHVAYQLWLYATHSTNTRLEIDRFSCCPQENFPVYYELNKIDSCESQEAMILFFTRNLSMSLSKVNNLFSSGQITNTMYSICCPLIRKGEVMEKDKIRLLGLKCVFNWLAVNENGSRVFLHTNREECWCRHSFLASNIHLYVEEEIRAYAGPFVIKFRLSLYHCPAVINIYNPCWCIYKGMGRMKSGSN